MAYVAEYCCRKCGHKWKDLPGPAYGVCPRCEHIRVDWLNWEAIVDAVYSRYYAKRED